MNWKKQKRTSGEIMKSAQKQRVFAGEWRIGKRGSKIITARYKNRRTVLWLFSQGQNVETWEGPISVPLKYLLHHERERI